MQACRVQRDLSWQKHNIFVTFSPTCNEPAETEEVQDDRADRAHDRNHAVPGVGPGVGQRQRDEAGRSQHYEVNGDVGLYWTTVQMYSPYEAGVQNQKKCQY